MERLIDIGGKSIKLTTNSAASIVYRRLFGRDIMKDMMRVAGMSKDLLGKVRAGELSDDAKIEAAMNMDTEPIYNMFYVFARLANPEIEPFETFFASIDVEPITFIFLTIDPVMELLQRDTETTVKKNTPPPRPKGKK